MASQDPSNKLCIVIAVYNRCEITLNCLELLSKSDLGSCKTSIVVVDDASTDGTSGKIKSRYPSVIVLQGDGGLWWGGATNLGVQYALQNNFEYILCLNDDVEFGPDFIRRLLETAESNKSAIVCGVVCNIDDQRKILAAGSYPTGFLDYYHSGYLSGLDIENLPTEAFESVVQSGRAMLVPSRAFIEVGLIDQKLFPHHLGDTDFSLRARQKGFIVLIDPGAHIYTKIGDNYFTNQILGSSFAKMFKGFWDIKSNVNLRTRWNFVMRHTPYHLGVVSFLYFLVRMGVAFVVKLILPKKVLVNIMSARVADTSRKRNP